MGNACGEPPEPTGRQSQPRSDFGLSRGGGGSLSREEIKEKATLAISKRSVREFTRLANNYSFDEHYETLGTIEIGAFGKVVHC